MAYSDSSDSEDGIKYSAQDGEGEYQVVVLNSSALQGVPEQRIIDGEEDWSSRPTGFRYMHAVGHSYRPPSHSSGPRSPGSDSSMVAAPSSSTWASSSTISDGSQSTSFGVEAIEQTQNLLEVDDQGLAQLPAAVWPCQYWFLGCNAELDNIVDWHRHCQGHFWSQDGVLYLPNFVDCPFCSWVRRYSSSDQAWTARWTHVVTEHQQGGQLRRQRPTPEMINHLWYKNIFDSAQRQRLAQSSNRPYLENASRSRDYRQQHPPGNGGASRMYRVHDR